MAVFVAALVSQGIYAGMVNVISSVTLRSVYLADAIYSYENPDVTAQIESLDVERRLKVIESVVKKINSWSRELNREEKLEVSTLIRTATNDTEDPIRICLSYVEDSVRKVNTHLTAIRERVGAHSRLWFHRWRPIRIERLMSLLTSEFEKLNSRFDDLTRISVFLGSARNH